MRVTPRGRFKQALDLAVALHRRQVKKGTGIPYASHLLSVAALAMQFGGTEDEAIAAVLHDAPEDQGGERTLRLIRRRFGRRVADVVEACSDTLEERKPAWLPRKQAYLEAIREKSPSALLVTACDKLDNARAIVADLRRDGPRTLERFNGGMLVPWYYEQVARRLRERCRAAPLAGTRLAEVTEELGRVVRALKRLAGLPIRRPGSAPNRVARRPTSRRRGGATGRRWP